MTDTLLPGILGLLLGLTLHWTGLSRPDKLMPALALRCCHALRSLLYALGVPIALTALMCYLAVIDVDGIVVLPLTAGVLIGGAAFGIAAGLCGFTPLTAFAGLGSSRGLEALCALAGCLAATLALPWLTGPLEALRTLPPQSATTLFEVTLDEPFLLGGGFLGQACAGLLLMAIAVCIPSNLRLRRDAPEEDSLPAEAPAPPETPAEEEAPTPEEPEAPDQPDEAEEPVDPPALPEPEAIPLLPAAAPEETFVALLPGEEPLVVDTGMDEEEGKAGRKDESPDENITTAEDPPRKPLADFDRI